ncbi:MAG: hypothetical protein WDO14_16460 [Bacteroidota bacterium]
MRNSNTTIWIGLAGLFITIISSSVFLGFRIGVIDEKVTSLEKSMEKTMADVSTLKTDVSEIRVKVDVLWKVHLSKTISSVSLNTDELNALKTSGLDTFAASHYPEILSKVRTFKPDNATQAQELLISVMNEYKSEDEYTATIREASRSVSYDVDSLLFIAAVSIRDRMIMDLGFEK